MSSDDARRRMEYSAIGGALAQLDSKNPQAAQLIAGLTRISPVTLFFTIQSFTAMAA